tara:strand:- start:10925 stop:12124 length:1200 start_codon:yes stop_codon:yes gene_type:complete
MSFIKYNKNYKPKFKQAVIFAGGKGLRLGKLTKNTPKPLLRIEKKKVFLEYLIQNLSRFGIKKILLLCNFKSEKFFKKYHKQILFGIKITCTLDIKNTSGKMLAIKKNLHKIDKNFILMNGDTFVDINFKKYQFLVENKKIKGLSIFLEKKIVQTEKNRYLIKTKKNRNYINSGIFYLDKKIIGHLNPETKDFDRELIQYLKKSLSCKIISLKKIKFIDIGIKKDLFYFKKNLNYFFEKKAIFLDRDGVINKDLNYVGHPKNFFWRKDIFSFIKKCIIKNYYIFIITNQSGIGRSYYSLKEFKNLCNWMYDMLSSKGLYIDDISYSPYYKESNKYGTVNYLKTRKPNPGMILNLRKKWVIDLKRSVVIGDSDIDNQLAKKIKIRFVKVRNNTRLNSIRI